MNKRKITLFLFLLIGILSLSSISFATYTIENDIQSEKIVDSSPIEVTSESFETIINPKVKSNVALTNDGTFLNDKFVINLTFNQEFYNDTSDLSQAKREKGALQVEVSFSSSSTIYNFVEKNVGVNFIYLQYGNYILKMVNGTQEYYLYGKNTPYDKRSCIVFENNKATFVVPFDERRAYHEDDVISNFYLFKIAEENGIDITKKDPWNFDLVIDFGILNGSYNQTNETFAIDDFNGISIKISGLSLE